jgi:hypothetical protein
MVASSSKSNLSQVARERKPDRITGPARLFPLFLLDLSCQNRAWLLAEILFCFPVALADRVNRGRPRALLSVGCRLVAAAGFAQRSRIVAVWVCSRSTAAVISERGVMAGGFHATLLPLPRCVSAMPIASRWLSDVVLEVPLRHTMF